MNQLSWCLSDEVAPYFNSKPIHDLCLLIDEKASKGLKYNDLKAQLLKRLEGTKPGGSPEIYNRACEFAKYY
jgi:hypothetical protein